MAVHELCTNAVKYGALAAETGHVDIGWDVEDGRFRWPWRERGGAAGLAADSAAASARA